MPGRAGLAQSVEQLICNQQVVGSIPTPGSHESQVTRSQQSRNSPMEQIPVIEDLVGISGIDSDLYFDHREFEARAWLEDEHYWHLARREVVLEALQAALSVDNANVLEIGCGAGTVATFLNEHGCRVDYADVHYEALELARKRARERLGADVEHRRFLRMDVCHDEIPSGFDAILLLDVLEHLPDDADALLRIRRALTESDRPGTLLLTVPAFPSLWSPYDEVEHHKRRYTRSTARAVLESCHFEVERMTYFFMPLFLGAGAVKMLRTVGHAVRRRPAPEKFTDLVETRSSPLLTRAMMRVLGAERHVQRKCNLPFGTSLLCVARAV
jgi:SAM-dependent methyltransferase